MNIREEKPNYGQTFSSAVVLRARALESYRNIKKTFEDLKEKAEKLPLQELTIARDAMNKSMMDLNKAQRLLHFLLAQYPEKENQINPLSDKIKEEMSEIIPYSSYIDNLHYHRMPVTVSNPWAKSTKPMLAVRPSREMRIHEAPALSEMPETEPRIAFKDENLSDDYHHPQDYDEGEIRDDVETMLSGLGATLNDLGGPGLVFLQRQLAKLIEKL